MKTSSFQNQRGFSLVMSLLVVTVTTMLVLGTLTFTGAERTASTLQTRAESLSACTQMARNLFLGRVQGFSADLRQIPAMGNPPTVDGGLVVQWRHFNDTVDGGVTIDSVRQLDPIKVMGGGDGVLDVTNRVGAQRLIQGHYVVSATCSEPTGASREVEFSVRVGL